MEGNNAPFAINQKVVCIKSGGILIKKGDVVTVAKQFQCPCCHSWFIGCLEYPVDFDICDCDCNHLYATGCFYIGGNSKYFAPIQTQYIDISKEIANSIKQTDEVPDKVLIPETINN